MNPWDGERARPCGGPWTDCARNRSCIACHCVRYSFRLNTWSVTRWRMRPGRTARGLWRKSKEHRQECLCHKNKSHPGSRNCEVNMEQHGQNLLSKEIGQP